jgi:hypothetical protein
MILHDKPDVLAENLVRLKPCLHQISHTNDPGYNPDDRSHLGTNVYLNYIHNLKARHLRCMFLY